MEKAAEAFRTISEVAELLDTPAHVLRFWESRFSQVKPVKRAGGRRYYRPTDLALLGGIKKLLHEDGLTIRGVQKILREQGVRHVADLCEVSLEPTDTARRKRATPGAAKRSAGTAARAAAPGTVPPAPAQPASAQPATATPASAAPSTAAPSTAAPSTAAPAAAPASDAGPWPMSPSPDAAATGDALRPDPEDRPDAEDGPDPDIIDVRRIDRAGGRLGLDREAEDAPPSDPLARRARRHVVLPQMEPLGLDGERRFEIVVDDQGHAASGQRRLERPAHLDEPLGTGGLVAQLDDRRPAGDGGARRLDHGMQAAEVGVEHEVERQVRPSHARST